MPTSRTSKVLQGVAVTSLTAVGAFFVWTKHCKFEAMNPATDPLFRTSFFSKFNPRPNPTMHDVCVRQIPLFKIRPDLIEDAQNGGSKLVEAFCAGVWGGANYTPQRKYMEYKYRSNPQTARQLWDKQALLRSTYEPGTQITDHFEVLRKTPQSILIRCGDSPLNSPDDPRDSDGLFEISANADLDKGFAEFRLKSVFYSGTGEKANKPLDGFMEWAHRQYTKLWMESAVRNCKR